MISNNLAHVSSHTIKLGDLIFSVHDSEQEVMIAEKFMKNGILVRKPDKSTEIRNDASFYKVIK